jgi:tRNA-specific 2-thiouridylase
MSGGVDSSVAASRLVAAGHEVVGLFMRHGEPPASDCATEAPAALPIVTARPGHKQGCCSASDAADARRVADRLGIDFYALDFREDFGRIVDYFVGEYTSGRTPNPCVMCNNWLKFGRLREYADGIGAEFIATGHYARLLPPSSGCNPALCRGIDGGKDQSYVLFGVDRELLPRLLFPVGEFRKEAIRELARELGLRVADKKDSQEICFIPDGDYAAFVRRHELGLELDGDIVTVEGEVVGHHSGLEQYTVGQRKGLGVALGEPRYVVRLETESRRVVIGRREQLARTHFTACRTNWLVDRPSEPLECLVQIRYLSQPAHARVIPLDGDRIEIELHEPKHGIAPGQAAVCYADDRVLGGGWIE